MGVQRFNRKLLVLGDEIPGAADGAVASVNGKTGEVTLTATDVGALSVSEPNLVNQSNITPRLEIAQWTTGSGHKSTGTSVNDVNAYYTVFGGLEYYSTSNTGYQMMGFGYNNINAADPVMPIGGFGLKQDSSTGDDLGHFIMAMRQTTSSKTIAEVFGFKLNGEIVSLLPADTPVTTDKSFTSKKYVDTVAARVPTGAVRGGVLQQVAIPDAAAAPTMEEFNALLAALRSAGVIAA